VKEEGRKISEGRIKKPISTQREERRNKEKEKRKEKRDGQPL